MANDQSTRGVGSDPDAHSDEALVPAAGRDSPSSRTTFFVAFGATTLEYYDFILYGIAASFIFGKVFFPTTEPLVGTMLSLATFGVGFAARPLGALVAGHYGDRHGRRPVLIVSLVLMGVSTMLVGALPGYGLIGAWAPGLLVLLRLLQGVATGGESGGAAVYGVESAPPEKGGLFGSFSGMGQSFGALLAAIVFTVVSAGSSPEFLFGWGWRLPFLLGGLVTFASIMPLVRAADTRAFTAEVGPATHEPARHPLVTLVREHRAALVLGTALSVGANSLIYVLLTFVLGYATTVGWSSTHALGGQIVLTAAVTAFIIVAGRLADRFRATRVLVVGSILSAVHVFVLFWAVTSGNTVAFYLNFAVAGAINATVTGTTPVIFARLFPTRVRYSGVSMSYQLGAAVSGFAPAVATLVFDASGRSIWAVAALGAGFAALVAACSVMPRARAVS